MGAGRIRSGKLWMLVYPGTRFTTTGLSPTFIRSSCPKVTRNSCLVLILSSLSRGDDNRGNSPNGRKSDALRFPISLDLTSTPILNLNSRQTERAYTPPQRVQLERPEQANTKSSETANGNASTRASCTEQV